MIFSDKRITTKTIKVRWHKYSDPEMGWGDAGTIMYAAYPRSAFIEKEEPRFTVGSYFTYEFTPEWSEKLKKFFDSDCWWYGRNYELYNPKFRMAERVAAKEVLRKSESIKHFVS